MLLSIHQYLITTTYHIAGKVICLLVAILASYLFLHSHLVETNEDVAVIWGYNPHTAMDFCIYLLVYAVCCALSIFILGRKYKYLEIAVYFVIFLCTCFFADAILASMEFDWPMYYSPKPIL